MARKYLHAPIATLLTVGAAGVLPVATAAAQKSVAFVADSSLATESVARVSDAALADALKKFGKLRDRQQAKVLAKVREAVGRLNDPYLRSVSALADRGAKKGKARMKPFKVGRKYNKSESAAAKSSALVDQVPYLSRYVYRWGYGDIAPNVIDYGKKRLSKKKRQRFEVTRQLESLCGGYPVDVDRALAAIMRELDNERSADRHAAFLDSWRNGEESFYDALARTAGTTNDIFCYDAMLFSWAQNCVGKKHPEFKQMRKSLRATQKAFYGMAGTYRRYRGLREMIALSLVLPTHQRLPERLARLYEDNAGSGYSTRDNITLLLVAHDGDIDATVQALLKNLDRMPEDTWHFGGYQPVKGVYATFDQLMPKLIAGGLHTDKVLALAKKERKALQDRVAQVARHALVAAL